MNDLRKFARYFRPYKKSLVLGVLCILVSVVVGLLVPLYVGRAVDELRAAPTWGKITRAALVILGVSVVSGLFLFLQRRILIGMSRHVEYDLRQRLLRAPASAPALLLPREPHGRPDGARDQRPRRRAPARRADGHVHAPDRLRRPLHPPADAADQRAPDAAALRDDAARLAHRQILRPAGAHALREDSGVLLAHLGARAGELLGRARRARLRAGGRGGRGLQRPQPRVRRRATSRSCASRP